jgi:hypothetical protein
MASTQLGDVTCRGLTVNGTTITNEDLDVAGNLGVQGDLAVSANVSVAGTATVSDLRIDTPTVPASAAAAGDAGDIAWANGFIYVCVATNTWQRAAIATWP